MNKKILAAALIVGCVTQANASTTTYGTRAAFDGAVGATTTETFSGCGSDTDVLDTNAALSAGSLGPCSSIVAGVSFAPDAGNSLYIAGPGQSANPTTALGVNTPSGGKNTISFAGGTNVFASDLFQNFGGGSQSGSPIDFTIALYDGSDLLIDSFVVSVASGTGSFFGVSSTSLIGKVTVSQLRGFAVVDNVSFNATGAVPEPASWAMMIAGFALAGSAIRSRKVRLAIA